MEFVQKLELLTRNLKKSQKVNSYDQGQEIEAGTIAHGLLDMEESFNVINNLIPKLQEEHITEEEIDETLLEIGEELRHILYHINDINYYGYLKVGDDNNE